MMRAPGYLVLALAWLATPAASAGIYTDELSKCMVVSTTESDRAEMVAWMFVAVSAHPAVEPLANVSSDQVDAASKTMAAILTRLLTESCLEASRKAFRYEGAIALQASMRVLGQVAVQELYSSPEVTSAMSRMERHLDPAGVEAKLEAR